MSRKAGKELRLQLAKDIWEAGSKDPETIAAYLIKKGWRPERKSITFVNSPQPQRAPLHVELNDSPVVNNAILSSLRNPHMRNREQY